jgi:glycosyltransferase involved in cell wall biosynthesis
MRILFWAELFWPYVGGVEVLSADLLRELRKRGHEFQVVTSHDNLDLSDVDQWEGIPIQRFRFREPVQQRDPAGIMRVRQQVGRLKETFTPDIVHLNYSGPSAFYHLATAGMRPCPWIAAIHRLLPENAAASDTLTTRVLNGADWITSVSHEVQATVLRLVPDLESHCSVVYNGLTPPVGTAPPSQAADPPQLLCVCRLLRWKGIDVALNALSMLLPRFPSLRLIVAGDGPARAELEEQAGLLGVKHAVSLVGMVSPTDVPALMSRATIVLVPSRDEEGFGLVALEAAFAERPVIASQVGGLPEVVLNGETGLIVPPDDAPALASAIASLLQDRSRAAALGSAARTRALTHFSVSRMADQYEGLYERLRVGGAVLEEMRESSSEATQPRI